MICNSRNSTTHVNERDITNIEHELDNIFLSAKYSSSQSININNKIYHGFSD